MIALGLALNARHPVTQGAHFAAQFGHIGVHGPDAAALHQQQRYQSTLRPALADTPSATRTSAAARAALGVACRGRRPTRPGSIFHKKTKTSRRGHSRRLVFYFTQKVVPVPVPAPELEFQLCTSDLRCPWPSP